MEVKTNVDESTGLLSDLDEEDFVKVQNASFEPSRDEGEEDLQQDINKDLNLDQKDFARLDDPEIGLPVNTANPELSHFAGNDAPNAERSFIGDEPQDPNKIEYEDTNEESEKDEQAAFDMESVGEYYEENDDQGDTANELDDEKLEENANPSDDEFLDGHSVKDDVSENDVELLGSRHASVIEIDSEDEIENLEEIEGDEKASGKAYERREKLTVEAKVPLESVTVDTGITKYALITEPDNGAQNSELLALFSEDDLFFDHGETKPVTLKDLINLIVKSHAVRDLPLNRVDDRLRITFNNIFTVTQHDSRTDNILFTEVLSMVRLYTELTEGQPGPMTISLDIDENPLAKYDRLWEEIESSRGPAALRGRTRKDMESDDYDEATKKRKISASLD